MPSLEAYRKKQVYAGLTAILIIILLLLIPYAATGAPAVFNAAFANEDTKYTELSTWDMDASDTVAGSSYYFWYNSSGDLNRNNLTISSGVLTVEENSTAGNNCTTMDTTEGEPYYYVVFDYTAQNAIDDGLVKIQLKVSGLTSNKAHTITLYAGDVTLFTTSIAKTDATTSINETVMVDVIDLMDAVVSQGTDDSYFILKITNEPNYETVSIASSAAYKYNVSHQVTLSDSLTVGGILFTLAAFMSAVYALPQYSLPTFNIAGRFGRRR